MQTYSCGLDLNYKLSMWACRMSYRLMHQAEAAMPAGLLQNSPDTANRDPLHFLMYAAPMYLAMGGEDRSDSLLVAVDGGSGKEQLPSLRGPFLCCLPLLLCTADS